VLFTVTEDVLSQYNDSNNQIYVSYFKQYMNIQNFGTSDKTKPAVVVLSIEVDEKVGDWTWHQVLNDGKYWYVLGESSDKDGSGVYAAVWKIEAQVFRVVGKYKIMGVRDYGFGSMEWEDGMMKRIFVPYYNKVFGIVAADITMNSGCVPGS